MEYVRQASYTDKSEPGSMGVCKDTFYDMCLWPRPDLPTKLFAEGSSGLYVNGPPTPRNILFPDDTIFVGNTCGDCFYSIKAGAREIARREHLDEAIENLTKEQAKALAR